MSFAAVENNLAEALDPYVTSWLILMRDKGGCGKGAGLLTVKEVAELSGVSVRTLHHYDAIGLLGPAGRTEAGYRLYGDAELARLQQILLLRELGFSLADIRKTIDATSRDRRRAFEQQARLLELKREHIDGLIELARSLAREEGAKVSFEAFDTGKMDEYAARAKEAWGDTPDWSDYQRRSAGRTSEEESAMGEQLMELFVPFAKMAKEGTDPASERAVAQAALIRGFICEHYYECSLETFAGLGRAYGASGEFTRNIDRFAGEGAAEFASRAVEAYCKWDGGATGVHNCRMG